LKNTLHKLLETNVLFGCSLIEATEVPTSKNYCYGHPSAIPMLLLAAEVFDDLKKECVRLAIQKAESLW
jgi:hypothetical protein